jgi:hypothetical protein
MRKELCTA